MEYINWSRLKTWRRCARQYHYKYVRNLRRRAPRVTLLRGSILHEMLHAHATQQKTEDVLSKYSAEYKQLFLEEREMYGTIIEDCRRIFAGYLRRWRDDETVFLQSEVQIRTQLLDDMEFVGTIDKIARSQGRLWLVDHKSHKRLPDESARLNDLQLVFYVWAWNREHARSEQVEGILWDYLRTKVPTVPERLKNGELTRRANIDTDYRTYLKAIEEANLDPKDYAEILDRLKGQVDPFYRRVKLPLARTPMEESIVADAKLTARTIRALASTPAGAIRTLDRTCDQCEFHSLCSAELRGHDWKFIQKNEYTDRPQESYDAQESDEESED